jgi:hypothetical protein
MSQPPDDINRPPGPWAGHPAYGNSQQPGQPSGQYQAPPQGYYQQQQPQPKKTPWWVWALVVFGVLVVIGTIANLAGVNNKSEATPTVAAVVGTTAPATNTIVAATTARVPVATIALLPTPTPRPTTTQAPTATPLPTNTPVPPTTTPNLAATQTAQLAATQAAQAKATADVQATIAALPKPISLTGNGDKVIQNISLNKGLAKVSATYTGTSNFIVTMLDANGKDIDLAANWVGNYNGSRFIHVPQNGQYLFQVESDGNWKIDILDVEIMKTQQPFGFPLKGFGDTALKVYIPKSGLNVFKFSHKGASNFVVQVINPQSGLSEALIANGIGNYSGEKAQQATAGAYYFDIQADGNWTVDIS